MGTEFIRVAAVETGQKILFVTPQAQNTDFQTIQILAHGRQPVLFPQVVGGHQPEHDQSEC